MLPKLLGESNLSRRQVLGLAGSAVLGASAFSALGAGRGTRVGAYYYPWYDTNGRHWDQGYYGRSRGKEPELGLYSSRSRRAIERHVEWSAKLGIDHWIGAWWGPESWEDHTLRRYVLPALSELESPPRLCLLYESAGLLGLDHREKIDFDESLSSRFVEHFQFLAKEYFSHPLYLRYGRRPVVYLYLSRCFAGQYERAIDTVRAGVSGMGFDLYLIGDEVYWGGAVPERIRCFDAVTTYNMHGPPEFAGLEDQSEFLDRVADVYRTYRTVAEAEGTRFIPGLLPGFDSRDAGGDHYPIPRSVDEGSSEGSLLAAYAKIAEETLDPVLRTVAVTSFNEWHEGTELEPSAGESLEPYASILKSL